MKNVYLVRSEPKNTFKKRLPDMLENTGWPQNLSAEMLVAMKLHFGERGNKGQIGPEYVAQFAKAIKERNAKPFMVETSTLYVGQRANAYDHILLALEHGYTYNAVGAPIIMADGLRGQARIKVKIKGKHYKEIEVASDVRVYDAMLILTHITGHVMSGLGGTIKNLGMGLASRAGKRFQHSAMKPRVIAQKCIVCGRCAEWCPTGAIKVTKGANSAAINEAACIGCGECFTVCPMHTIKFDWNANKIEFQEKMAEHALGIVTGREEQILHIAFLTSITRNCDCMGSDNRICVDNIGVVASHDPVAIDQASADLVNKKYGKDFFRESFPDIDYTIQLKHGEAIGLGSRKYKLVEL